MPLVLSVLRCPDQSVPEQRRVPGGEYTLGRGAECDWALRDPDRVLSKRHCSVEFLSGAWQVRDLSTNGTFINGAGEALGREQVRVLRDGDRLRLGAYEIECRVEEEAAYGSGRWQSSNAIPDPMAPQPASDIFSAPLPGLSPAGGTPSGHAPLLPSDFDPFAPDDAGPVMPDHRPSTNDVFTPPRAMMPDLLPNDWDGPDKKPPALAADPFAGIPDPFADAPPPRGPGTSSAPRLPDPFADLGQGAGQGLGQGMGQGMGQGTHLPPAEKLADPFADLGMAPPPAAAQSPAPAPPPAPAPATAPAFEARLPDPFADLPPATPPAVAATFVASATPNPFNEAPRIPPAVLPDPFAEPAPPPLTVAPVMVASVPQAPPPEAPVTGDSLQAALALIHQAAGLGPPAPNTDAAAALAAVGAGMRAAVSGMRGLLIARADVKREFRIEQTMLRAAGNNPVKFAATDEAAVLALLSPRGNGPAALRETVQDLTAHQVATVAATQAAAKALLARLSPIGLEAEIPSGGIMPGAREKKLWEAYRRLHQQVTDQFEDDFDSAFGKAFARAYEEASRGGT